LRRAAGKNFRRVATEPSKAEAVETGVSATRSARPAPGRRPAIPPWAGHLVRAPRSRSHQALRSGNRRPTSGRSRRRIGVPSATRTRSIAPAQRIGWPNPDAKCRCAAIPDRPRSAHARTRQCRIQSRSMVCPRGIGRIQGQAGTTRCRTCRGLSGGPAGGWRSRASRPISRARSGGRHRGRSTARNSRSVGGSRPGRATTVRPVRS